MDLRESDRRKLENFHLMKELCELYRVQCVMMWPANIILPVIATVTRACLHGGRVPRLTGLPGEG